MNLIVDIYREEFAKPTNGETAVDEEPEPTDQQLTNWLTQAYTTQQSGLKKTSDACTQSANLTVNVALVSPATIQGINERFRDKAKPTNVLSFPADVDHTLNDIPLPQILGDILLCPTVIEEEAILQSKCPEHHWAHIAIHGLLHLLGYDHVDEDEAISMESLEVQLLANIGIANPYQQRAQ